MKKRKLIGTITLVLGSLGLVSNFLSILNYFSYFALVNILFSLCLAVSGYGYLKNKNYGSPGLIFVSVILICYFIFFLGYSLYLASTIISLEFVVMFSIICLFIYLLIRFIQFLLTEKSVKEKTI
jgi:hypothetical protein